jgi:hypothetical protein
MKVNNSLFSCSHHLFLSISFRFQSLFIYFTGSVTFFLFAYALFPTPLSDLGKPKEEEKGLFSPMYALSPVALCDLGRSKVTRKVYNFWED